MDQLLMDEQLSKRNKRLAALLAGIFVVMLVSSTVILMVVMSGR